MRNQFTNCSVGDTNGKRERQRERFRRTDRKKSRTNKWVRIDRTVIRLKSMKRLVKEVIVTLILFVT